MITLQNNEQRKEIINIFDKLKSVSEAQLSGAL